MLIAIVSHPRGSALCMAIAEVARKSGLDCSFHEAMSLDQVEDLENVEVLLVLLVPCGAKEMEKMPRLRGIVSPLLGYDWIDVDEATKRGIAVVNSEVIENREGMAEATIMLLLALLYRLHETEALLRNNIATDTATRHLLKGRTVGIIGYGGISRAVIERLLPWGCHFLVHSRAKKEAASVVTFTTLYGLLAGSDAILVLTGLDASTRHMLGAEQFAKVRPGTVLVNTARGPIIDEVALIEALKSGRLGSAALDVFEVEPLPHPHPLRELPNVILTPHATGHNQEAREAGPRVAVENLRLLVNDVLPSSCQNRALLEDVSNITIG